MSARWLAALAFLVVALAAAVGFADGDDAEVDAALAAGDIAPLDDLLARVRARFPGRVLRVEVEHEDENGGLWVYEVKLLTADGRVLRVDYDARALEVLEVRGRSEED